MTKEQLITRLGLQPHPEGGYYRETYRSKDKIQSPVGERVAGTVIYFMIESGNYSAFHRLTSDEAWYYHAGHGVHIHLIAPDGQLQTVRLGSSIDKGEELQAIMPAGYWFAAEVLEDNAYALVSCSVSPGFEFSDFELADREVLLKKYPLHAGLIARLCR